MIGITRTEIDRSQVLRPVSGNAMGMVLRVPYGPLTPTTIDNEGLLLEYFSIKNSDSKYLPNPSYQDYYEAMVLLKEAPILACRPQGDALFGGVTVQDVSTGNAVAGLGAGASSISGYTFPDNETQFTLFGADPSVDNNNFSVQIVASTSSVANTFDIQLYHNSILQTTFNVSLRRQKDGFDNSVYIEDVIKDRTDVQVVVNQSADLDVLPTFTVSAVSFAGGSNITSFDTSSVIAAWNYFSEYNNYPTKFLVDTSANATIGKAVISIAETNWYQHVIAACPSIKSTNPKATETLTTFSTTTQTYRDINGSELNVNSDHISLYAVWGELNDNYNRTTVWISPASTAAARRAFTNKNIGFSHAAAGLNRNRGTSNDFIRLEQDASTIVGTFEAVEINALVPTPGGNAIWNERTLSTSFSNTSFQSHRNLFNVLEENVEALLLTFVFTDNNEDTRAQLTSILEAYILPLIGTDLDDAEVRCNSDNNTAEIINQRQMKVQIAVIPYAKANEIIFEFIHTRSGVTLSEVF